MLVFWYSLAQNPQQPASPNVCELLSADNSSDLHSWMDIFQDPSYSLRQESVEGFVIQFQTHLNHGIRHLEQNWILVTHKLQKTVE